MVRIGELVLMGIIALLVGFAVSKHYYDEVIHDMKVEAVTMDCGYWDMNGDFDWKSPELDMEVEVINETDL